MSFASKSSLLRVINCSDFASISVKSFSIPEGETWLHLEVPQIYPRDQSARHNKWDRHQDIVKDDTGGYGNEQVKAWQVLQSKTTLRQPSWLASLLSNSADKQSSAS